MECEKGLDGRRVAEGKRGWACGGADGPGARFPVDPRRSIPDWSSYSQNDVGDHQYFHQRPIVSFSWFSTIFLKWCSAEPFILCFRRSWWMSLGFAQTVRAATSIGLNYPIDREKIGLVLYKVY